LSCYDPGSEWPNGWASRSTPGGGCGSGGTGASLAHVQAFEEARDPYRKGERSAQVAEQGEAEGVEQGEEVIHKKNKSSGWRNYSVEKRNVLNLQPVLGSSSS